MLANDRLLEESNALDRGFFTLAKVALVIPGKNVPRTDRRDNFQVTGLIVTQNTEYESQASVIGKSSLYSDSVLLPKHITKIEYPIYYSPSWLISYIEVLDDKTVVPMTFIDPQTDPTPSTMWLARSIYQLFKNIREWSFMVDEPFSSDHPMATYSKLVIDSLNPPQEILDEIDAMPDMHLAKFLKGQSDYKQIPPHVGISQLFKDWILEISQQYPYKRFEEQL